MQDVVFISDNRFLITELRWERLFLELTVESSYEEAMTFAFAQINISKGVLNREHPIIPVSCADGTYRFRINMSLASGKTFLESGRWHFIVHTAKDNDGQICLCCASFELAHRLDDLSKVFVYGNDKFSYNVSFMVSSYDNINAVPVLISKFMVENRYWKESNVISQSSSLKGKWTCIKKRLRAWYLQRVYDNTSKSRRGEKKNILFMSETRPYLWGNLKYLDDRIKKRGLDKEFTIEYSFNDTASGTTNSQSMLRMVKQIARQDYVFIDDYSPILRAVNYRPETKIIQLWHAGVGFKSVGYCRFGQSESPLPEGSHRKYSYAVVGSESLVDVYSEVFGQPKEKILPLGMARLDGYLDYDVIAKKTSAFYDNHPELKGKKMVLFCPTFRGSSQKNAYYDYSKIDLARIYEFCADEFVWAFKMHPFIKEAPTIPDEYKKRIIDFTEETNINDLYYVTDIMITDYSSAYYEYSLFNRPVLFYTYDRDLYAVTRGVHRTILDTAPGKVCDTFDELMDALKNKDYEIEKTLKFREENFSKYDGHAADKIIDTILLK